MKGLVVPPPTEDFTADPVELFFDLAFVFAFSQLVSHLVHYPTLGGVAEAGLIFLILWFAWSTFTWSANAVQGNARPVRAVFLVATAASVPMGASVGTAYDAGGPTFAICASIIVLMAIGLQAWGLSGTGSDEFRSVLRYGVPNIAAMSLLILGAFLSEGTRKILWVLFVLILFGAMAAARSGDWLVRPGHFAERHGLITIIALGEVIVAIGISVVTSLGTGEEGLPGQTLAALTAAGVLAGLLWWSYFDRVQPALEHRGEQLQGRERAHYVADVYTALHIFVIGGIILIASASEEILLHPKDEIHTEFLVMFVAGVVLFFGGIAAAAGRAYQVLAFERLGAIAAVAIVALVARSWSGLAFLVAIDVVLLAAILLENRRIESPAAAPA